MALIRNPHDHDLFVPAIGATLPAGEAVHVADDVAAAVPRNGVLEVSKDGDKSRPSSATGVLVRTAHGLQFVAA